MKIRRLSLKTPKKVDVKLIHPPLKLSIPVEARSEDVDEQDPAGCVEPSFERAEHDARSWRRATVDLPSRLSSTRLQTWRKSLGLSVMTPSMKTVGDGADDLSSATEDREDVEEEGGRAARFEAIFLRMHHSIHFSLLTVQARTGRPACLALRRNQWPRGPTRRPWNMLKARLGMGRKWRE